MSNENYADELAREMRERKEAQRAIELAAPAVRAAISC